MDVVLFSRIQVALTTAFHIVFSVLTIGLAVFLVIVAWLWLRSKNEIYYRRWCFRGRFYSYRVFHDKIIFGKVMNNQVWDVFSGSGGTFMAFIRIKQIVLRTGQILLLGVTLFLVEQIPFNDMLYGAGSQLKSAPHSQKDSGASFKRILEIDSDVTSSSAEIINIVLTGPFPPEAQVIEGDAPRIFCDFPDVRMEKNISRTIVVNGRYVLQIRTGIHPPPESKSRVVLDLVPNHDYEVEQFFFEQDNRYSIVIREKP